MILIRHRYEVQNGKGDPIAHVEVDNRDGVLWLTNLWVDPDCRRQGHANALLAAAVGEWPCHDLYLHVQPYTDQPLDADGLAALYRRFGFVPTVVPGVMRRLADR